MTTQANEPAEDKEPDPAFPFKIGYTVYFGMTKREYACIKLRIPETGDEFLDNLIRAASRRDIAAMAMQGLLNAIHYNERNLESISIAAIKHADALLAELNREKK